MDAGNEAAHGVVVHIGSHCPVDFAQIYSLGVTSLAKVGILVGLLLSFALEDGFLVVGVVFGRHDDIVAQMSSSGLLQGRRKARHTQVESEGKKNGSKLHLGG